MKLVDPTSASAYLLKQMDSTYGHESREMYPTKDYFRTNVAGEDLLLEATKPARKTIVNYDNLSKEE